MQPANSPAACRISSRRYFGFEWTRRTLWVAVAFAVISTSGCSLFPGSTKLSGSAFRFPSLHGLTSGPPPSSSELQANYVPVGAGADLPSSTFTQEVYEGVRNAKANNSIVLQILDDDVPIRVLPLPPTGSGGPGGGGPGGGSAPPSVYVSTLLQQTGVLHKLGKVQAALYRPAPDSLDGVRMDVLFSSHDAKQVRPESDYALRAGDRLVVRKDSRLGMDSLIDMVLDR